MKKRRRREKYAFSASQSTEFRFLAPAAGFSSTQPFSVKSSLQTRLMELLNRFLCMTFCLGKEKTQDVCYFVAPPSANPMALRKCSGFIGSIDTSKTVTILEDLDLQPVAQTA